MKKLLLISLLLSYTSSIQAQSLNINTTRFVGGDSSCGVSQARYSIYTRDDGILFVGLTDCFVGGGNIPASPSDASAESAPSNVLIGKLDSNMNVSWVKVYGGSWQDVAVSAVQTIDGGYAVLAYTKSNNRDISGNHGSGDLWLVRIDRVGNLLWQKCYGSSYDEQPGAIALTPDNGFIMYGISNGSGGEVPTHYGTEFNYNWFVVKTDSIGNMQWSKTIGGTGYGTDGSGEQPWGSIFYADNGYYFVSSTNSTDYDCTDTFWHPGVNTSYDYYMFKLDTAGNILWDSSYGGGGSDIAYQAIWDSRDSSIVINGSTTSDNYMITGNHGESDMGVMKIDKNGVYKWAKCLGSPNNESGNSICCTSFGYIAYGATSPGSIGETDCRLFSLNTLGDTLYNLQFGGTGYDDPFSIIPFKNGFAATGGSGSPGFTEGINIGPLVEAEGDAFVSYINYFPLAIQNVVIGNQQIIVYPNPSNSILRITLPNQAGSLTVINCVGQNIYYETIKQKETININIASWASGIYIAKWQSADGTVLTKKFIKT